MRVLRTAALVALFASGRARAGGPLVEGEYESPLGRVRVIGAGGSYRAVLVSPAGPCGFSAGDEVLRATLLDDSLAGQVRVCLEGTACKPREEWASAVLLASHGNLSGAVHVAAKGCTAPVGKRGGVVFTRAGAANPTSTTTSKTRARATALLRDGAAYLTEGVLESARERFLEAIEIDPKIPEAYNGVGVTYRMRNDLARALEWYKKALAIDPDFGDAYYNIACVYALEGRKEMALRYLQIAALNGYATAAGIDEDPDLEILRGEPGYRALRARM